MTIEAGSVQAPLMPPGVSNPLLWRLSKVVSKAGFNKLASKLYRKSLVTEYRHNYSCGPNFNLLVSDSRFHAFIDRKAVVAGGLNVPRAASSRRCLILGSGPSANQIDNEYFNECDIIAANGSILKCIEKGVKAKVYIVQDPNFIDTGFDIFKQGVASTDCLALSSHAVAAIVQRDPSMLEQCPVVLLERVNRAFMQARLDPEALTDWVETITDLELLRVVAGQGIGWSHDPSRGVFTGSTVAYSALQVAVSMGYRSIFLGGVDFTAGASGKRFYIEKDGGAVSHLERNFNEYIKPSFEFAADVLANKGVEVNNLSKVSLLSGIVIRN